MLKTLVWEGHRRDAEGGISANGDGHFRELADPALISDLLATHDHLVWLDLTSPSEEELRLIAEEFALHPLAVEDAARLPIGSRTP